MASYNQIQNSFISGELSPLAQERYDTDDHLQAAARLENFRTLPQGGITRRSGTICLTRNLIETLAAIEEDGVGDLTDFSLFRNGYLKNAIDNGGDDLKNLYRMIKLIPYSLDTRRGFVVLIPYRENFISNNFGVQAYILFPKEENAYNTLDTSDTERPAGFNYLNEHLNTKKDGNLIFECANFKDAVLNIPDPVNYAVITEYLTPFYSGVFPNPSFPPGIELEFSFKNFDFDHAQIGDYLFMTNMRGTLPPVVIGPIDLPFSEKTEIGVGSITGGLFGSNVGVGSFPINGSLNRDITGSGPYRTGAFSYPSGLPNVSSTTLAISTPLGTVVTASTDLFTQPSKWIGKVLFINEASFTNAVMVGSVLSPTEVSVQPLKVSGSSVSATTDWSVSQWGGLDGFPKTVTIFQQRVCFGGSIGFPDTVWISGAGQLFRYYQYKANDDTNDLDDTFPFSIVPSSGEASEIKWISSSDVLEVGCNDQEFNITSVEGIFGPFNFNVRAHTSKGGSLIRAERLNKATFFISKDRKNMMSYNKIYQTGEYDTLDLGVKTDFLINSQYVLNELKLDDAVIRKYSVSRIEDMVWILVDVPAKSRVLVNYSFPFADPPDNDFDKTTDVFQPKWETRLYSFTYNETGQVTSMQRHKLGSTGELDRTPFISDLAPGAFNYLETDFIPPAQDPIILDMVALDDRGVAKLLLMTLRDDGNEGEQLCLEMIRDNRPRTMIDEKGLADSSKDQDLLRMSTYLDMHFFIKETSGKTSFTVADNDPLPFHLANREVTVMGYNADNELRVFKDVEINADGEFSIPEALRSVLLGLPYSSIMTSLRVNQGALFGSSQGLTKRTHEANIKVLKSKGGRFSPKTDQTKSSPLNYPVGAFSNDELFTGNVRLFARNSPDEDRITIFTDDPLPLTVLNLVQQGILYDS